MGNLERRSAAKTMNSKVINFKGKNYKVYDPGELLVSDDGFLLDQLDESLEVMRYTKLGSHIRSKYGISAEDYYVIVVLHGDKSKLPNVCHHPECNNRTGFRSLSSKGIVYGEYCSRSCKQRDLIDNKGHIFKDHNWASARTLKQVQEGKNPFQGQKGSELSRRVQLERIANGTHHLAGPNSYDLHSRITKGMIESGTHAFSGEKGSKLQSQLQRKRVQEGTHQWLGDHNHLSLMKGHRTFLLNKYSKSDQLVLYYSVFSSKPDIIKIGVTRDIEMRKLFSSTEFSSEEYEECYELKVGSRDEIANLEYDIKVHFYDQRESGLEYFSKNLLSEIIEFINK